MAREGKLRIGAFPDFRTAVDELKMAGANMKPPEFECCVPLGDGSLVVKQALIDLWTVKNKEFTLDAEAVLQEHNKRWNTKGVKRGAETQDPNGGYDETSPPAKRIRVDNMAMVTEQETHMEDKCLG